VRRADRLLQILQVLRRNRRPMTALAIAQELEVSKRTIYRDIACLQASHVPIEGEAGIGYVLHPGHDLPPLMFTVEEIDAIVLGMRLVRDRGDAALAIAAEDVTAKVAAVLPKERARQLDAAPLFVPRRTEAEADFGAHVLPIREAIRSNRKLSVFYRSESGEQTQRTIWPIGMYFYSHITLLAAWCELRAEYRAFRTDRIVECTVGDERFNPQNGKLLREFASMKPWAAGAISL
jgi:predicted DNA-binding transcriptional regulator YafY